ncbi:hypothetical protein KC326_g41 [Hortaea werneckii]|nr:hypothetical protein KC326_g41 [Hortaea werneckii]
MTCRGCEIPRAVAPPYLLADSFSAVTSNTSVISLLRQLRDAWYSLDHFGIALPLGKTPKCRYSEKGFSLKPIFSLNAVHSVGAPTGLLFIGCLAGLSVPDLRKAILQLSGEGRGSTSLFVLVSNAVRLLTDLKGRNRGPLSIAPARYVPDGILQRSDWEHPDPSRWYFVAESSRVAVTTIVPGRPAKRTVSRAAGSRCLGGSTQKRHINARPSAFEDARVLALKTRAMTAFGLLALSPSTRYGPAKLSTRMYKSYRPRPPPRLNARTSLCLEAAQNQNGRKTPTRLSRAHLAFNFPPTTLALMSSLRTPTSVSRPKHDAGNAVKNDEGASTKSTCGTVTAHHHHGSKAPESRDINAAMFTQGLKSREADPYSAIDVYLKQTKKQDPKDMFYFGIALCEHGDHIISWGISLIYATHRNRIVLTFVLMHVITGNAGVVALIERIPFPTSQVWRAASQQFTSHDRYLKDSGRIRSHLSAGPEMILDKARAFAGFAMQVMYGALLREAAKDVVVLGIKLDVVFVQVVEKILGA